MATVNLFRGGVPDFKPSFCCGDFPAYMPVCNMTHFPGTPPFDNHSEGARGQGYLNLSLPFVPNLLDTDAHRWMRTPLQELKAANDILHIIQIPHYGYVDSLCMVLTQYDTALDGVYVTPVSQRSWWNPTTKECEFKDNDAFDTAMATYANAQKLCLGTPAAASGSGDNATPGDASDIFARFPQEDSTPPWSFGHDRYKVNAQGELTGPEDDFCGVVCFGLKFTGPAAKIADVWRSKFELWINMKFLQHDCQGFTG